MNTTIANFINNILLEGLYLSLWVCFLAINIYRQQILIKDIDSLKKKQDILFESIQKLKIIIDIDKETEDIVSANVAILQTQLNDIDKRIEKRIEESESDKDFLQDFPTFPHFTTFDDSNYISENNKILFIMKSDTRLLSNELAMFLQKEKGSCITFAEAYTLILELDPNLKRLFGIIGNEDNEITPDTLSAYLEPHLKKIN